MTNNTERPIAESGFTPVDPREKMESATPERSGLESGFYVEDRGLPWHVELSRRLDTPELMAASGRKLTVGEALVLAGLDWDVDKAPLYAQIGRQRTAVPDRFATYRTDTGAILGSGMSGGYKLVQNRDAFGFADAILDVGGAHCESAGSLFGGRQVFLSMELPDEIHVEGDPSDYRLFLLISNGHDGDHKLRYDITIERVLCRNTLRFGHARAISSWAIRHTSSLEGRVAEARSALQLSYAYAESFGESASALVALSLAERQVDAILADIFPLTETQQERIDKDPSKLAALPVGIARAIYHESPSIEPIRGTGFGVLNAVTEYEDHFRAYRDGKRGSAQDARADRLMFDEGSPKSRALDVLTAMVKA